jgi:hypothetical protein
MATKAKSQFTLNGYTAKWSNEFKIWNVYRVNFIVRSFHLKSSAKAFMNR